jgi:flagellin
LAARLHGLAHYDLLGPAVTSTNSINTNTGALVALRHLNVVGTALSRTQERVSTGLKVIGARDDASSFAIAQGIRAEVKAVLAVQQGLSNGRGVASVGLAAATEISNLMADIKAKVVEGLNPGNTATQQQILDTDYGEMVAQIRQFLEAAEYQGTNILIETFIPFNGIVGTVNDVDVIAGTDGTTMRLRGQRLDLTAFFNLDSQDLANTTNAAAALTAVNTAIDDVNTALGQLGADARSLESHDQFLNAISDALEEGLGSIVDADLAAESAKLTAEQVRQQLAVQVLGIANASPQVILGLFR